MTLMPSSKNTLNNDTPTAKSKLKWIVLVSGVLLLLFCAPVVMLLLLDVNTFKGQISAMVKEKTGRQFEIKGEIHKSLFPWLGLTLSDTHLSNPSGFTDARFVDVGKLSVQVEFWPLLRGKTRIDTLHLEDLTLHLITEKDGRHNWAFGDTPAAATGLASLPKSMDQAAAGPDPLTGLDLAGLDIRHANLKWDDRQSGLSFVAQNLNLKLSEIETGKPANLSLESEFASLKPSLSGSLEIEAVLTLALADQDYQVELRHVQIEAKGDLLPKSPLTAQLSGNLHYNGQTGLAELKEIKLRSDKLELLATLSQTQALPPVFKGHLSLPSTNLRQQLTELKIPLPPDLPAQALQQFSLDTSFTADLKQLSLTDIKIQLDQTHISGTVSQLQYAPFALDWNLDIDTLNLDSYLPPTPTQAADAAAPSPTPATTAAPNASDTAILPLALLRELALNGETRIGQFNGLGLQLSAIKLGFNAHQGVLRLQPFEVSLYGGKMAGSAGLNAKTDLPKLRLIQRIKDVNASELLKAVANTDLVNAAKVNANLDIDTVGNRLDEWKQNLHGTAQLRLQDGAVNGVNLLSGLIEKYEKYLNQDFPRERVEKRTVFTELTGSFNIDQGIVDNKDFMAVSPEIKLDGGGKVDLPQEKLDLRLTATPLKLPTWVAANAAQALRDTRFPVTMRGPFAAPEIDYDIGGPLKDQVKRSLDKKLDAKKAELKQQLMQKQGDALSSEKSDASQRLEEEKARAKEKLEQKREELKERFKRLF